MALRCVLVATLGLVGRPSPLQALQLGATPPGVVESGAPAFVVLGPEAIGFATPPTDLQTLPDGRIIIAAGSELALGDGVRWELYRQLDGDRQILASRIAVDDDGGIYCGVSGGFARIELAANNRWFYSSAAHFPDNGSTRDDTLATPEFTTDNWYWHSGGGTLASWRPGRPTRVLGHTTAISRVFAIGGELFVSGRSDGMLARITNGEFQPLVLPPGSIPPGPVLSTAPFDEGRLLLGTYTGLQLFDGHTVQPFSVRGPLSGMIRINDLTAAGPDHFAAAVDGFGIVFVDRSGRIVQTLDRTLDQRMAHTQRLHYRADGVLWAVLNEGVARIEFPKRLSHFESLVATGAAYAVPARHEGKLWLLSNNRVHRGVYSADQRLQRFEEEPVPGGLQFTLSAITGRLLATNFGGIYQRDPEGWRLVVPGIVNARIETPSPDQHRWLYVALDEVGWLRATPEGFVAERTPVPGMGNSFATVQDSAGVIWTELGAGRVARIDPHRTPLAAELFGPDHGLPDGWVQVFVIEGRVRFDVSHRLLRFDEATRRFVPDEDLIATKPALTHSIGRPAHDAAGRIWYTANGTVHLLGDPPSGPGHLGPDDLPAFLAHYFCMQDDGVVWMGGEQQLVRYDPAMPASPKTELRALITRLDCTGSNRVFRDPRATLGVLPFEDNSFVAHFLAPANPFKTQVTFEVLLEGATTRWISTGITGSAVFNRLKEGHYVLRVRPVANGQPGTEARVAFTIAPPWFRTLLAYVIYGVSAVGLIMGIAWWFSYLERREKARLEQLVARRTTQLAQQVSETLAQAAALQASEERYRRLSQELEHRVGERTAELTASNHELESFSYSISHDLRAPLRNISGFADLLRKRLQPVLDSESARFLGIVATESVRLGQLIDCLLSFSRLGRTDLKLARLQPATLVAEARLEFSSEFAHREIEFRVATLPEVQADPTLLRQVFTNLIGNALKFTRDRTPAIVEIGATTAGPTGAPASAGPREHIFFVRDNGVGFDPQYSDKLFGVFQRLHHTRDFEGTGIGLANVKRIVVRHGGRVWAEGIPGQGATFYFTLPACAPGTPSSSSALCQTGGGEER